MCGRYAASKEPAILVEEFGVVETPAETLEPDYNVAPTKKVYAVLDDARRSPVGVPQRRLAVVKWGLVPSWAKDRAIGAKMTNARRETITEKVSYKRAFARRRCLLPADGYYEWYTPEVESGKPRKQPFFISRADGDVAAMAGLYELWRDKDVAEDDPGAWLWTVTVITTAAADSVSRIHDRMPVILPRQSWDQWLDPAVGATESDQAALLHLVDEARAVDLRSWPVSTEVNNSRSHGPHLLDPLPPS